MSGTRHGDWLAPVAAAMSLVVCYGTLLAVGLLGALGVAVALDEAVWAGAIIAFAGLALVVLGLGWRRHRRPGPVALAGIGFGLIVFTMLVAYSHIVELAGFVLLCWGTALDWRIARKGRA